MDMFALKGEIAFVTGAGSGIGQAIAVGLAQSGADVACFDLPSQETGLQATITKIEAAGRKGIAVQGNVTDAKSLADAISATESQLGPLTLAVNCAGIANAAPAEDMALEQFQNLLKVNVEGVFLSCQAEARVMLPRTRGSIVNIGSISGSIANRGLLQAHYNSAKAAVIHMSKSLALEWADRGLRVNSISPGYTLTPMNLRPDVAEHIKKFENDVPMGRMAVPEEMVGPAIFLLSKAASYVTAHDLIVDGGCVAW